MRISELADASGESIPTLKFYIRKGLLPPGDAVASNRAEYGARHLSRLELIATLKNELGMSLDRIAEVFEAAAGGGEQLLRSGLDAAHSARHGSSRSKEDSRSKEEQEDPHRAQARCALRRVCDELGWAHPEGDPALNQAADALVPILRASPGDRPEEFLPAYARAMKQVADEEIPDTFDPEAEPWDAFKYAVLGTYLYEPLILALRRMAHGQRTYELAQARSQGEREGSQK